MMDMSTEKGAKSQQDGVEMMPKMQMQSASYIANPAPAGLFSFAATTFLLSLYNVSTRGVHTPNVVVGMAIFTGGILQFFAGMWEFPRGNVFGATAFASYGAFWMSYAAILLPGTGVATAYTNQQELANAIGLYLVVWFMFTVMLIPAVVRRHLGLTLLLTALALAFILLAAAEFTGKESVLKAGGALGIITAFIAYYIAVSDLIAAEEKPIARLPLGIW